MSADDKSMTLGDRVGAWRDSDLAAQRLTFALNDRDVDRGQLVLEAFDVAVAVGDHHLLGFARGLARAMVRDR